MYKIGNVLINDTFYKGEDRYSDGDIEDEILAIVKEHKDYTDIIHQDDRWPILYHLSPIRRNILEWYDFKPGSSVLEIGAGCGAITGLLCEKAERVVVVELSKRRAEINANRHSEHSNLEIMLGNLNDIQTDEKFDYITLIGVLEYAGEFTEGPNPYETFLKNIKQYLKPNGKLIIAIENKFGLKYWAGAREDHTGMFFDSLEGYVRSNKGVKTFSKNELIKLLKESEFSNNEFYYPFPDYKMPSQVYSDEYLPDNGVRVPANQNYDNDRLLLFNEVPVWDGVISEKKLPFFSNSFLVICGGEI